LIGPTATYLESPVLPASPVHSLDSFADEARRLVPEIGGTDLEYAGAGIRAKTVPPGSGEAFGDFLLREEPDRSGAFHLIGVESPGLTASFAVAQRVVEWWRERSS
jgi:L-2-hydroxyglutarate oxidase LhgO